MSDPIILKITQVLEANMRNRYQEGAAIADLLRATPEHDSRVRAMAFLIQNYGVLEATGKPVPLTGRDITPEHWKKLREIEGEVMDAQVKRAFRGFPAPEDASEHLLAAFATYQDREAGDFFIANLLADSRVPYFGLPSGQQPLKMEDERFKALNRQLRRQIKQVEFLIRHADYYEQRTERASLLLAVLNSVDTPEEQVVLLVHVLRVPEEAAREILLRQLARERGE